MTSGNEIVYYDFNELNYSSFFLTGFLHNTKRFDYRFTVSKDVPSLLEDPATDGRWRALLFSICLFKARLGGREFHFCIDARDSCESARDRGGGYHLPLLERVAYYFKVNYNADAIERDPNLRPFIDRILPARPFFPVAPPGRGAFLPRFLPCRTTGWGRRQTARRFKDLLRAPRLEDVVRLRGGSKDLDLFFVMMYYPEPVHAPHNEIRYRVMREIRKVPDIASIAGFAARDPLPQPYEEFRIPPFRLKAYLSRMAGARIGIYVRGLYDCISFKLPQFLALGLPIVGQPIPNNRRVLYDNEFFDEQFAFDDPVDIVREAVRRLREPERLARLGESNARAFDRKFTPEAAVSEILTRLTE